MTTILRFLFLLFAGSASLGYSQTQYRPAAVGEKMPDYIMKNLINYTAATTSMKVFEGKWTFYYLWSSSCASCIAGWPKLLELQREFEGKAQFVLVNTYENEEIVRKTFERRKRLANVDMTLPTVCGDTILGQQVFRHSGVPYVAWVDPEGYVRSITYSASVNSGNIRRMLEGYNVPMPQYRSNDSYIIPDFGKPLYMSGYGDLLDQVAHQSFWGKSIEGMKIVLALVSDTVYGRYYAIVSGYGINDMFRLAFGKNPEAKRNVEALPQSMVVYEGPDTASFFYHLVTPALSREKIQEMMRADLHKHLNLSGKWEKRTRECLVLKLKDTTLAAYKGGSVKRILSNERLLINKVTVRSLLDGLVQVTDYYSSPYPLIDETGYSGELGDIDIEVDIMDHKKLNDALSRYGIEFVLETRELDTLVVRSTDGS